LRYGALSSAHQQDDRQHVDALLAILTTASRRASSTGAAS